MKNPEMYIDYKNATAKEVVDFYQKLKTMSRDDLSQAQLILNSATAKNCAIAFGFNVGPAGTWSEYTMQDTLVYKDKKINGVKNLVLNLTLARYAVMFAKEDDKMVAVYCYLPQKGAKTTLVKTLGLEATNTGMIEFDDVYAEKIYTVGEDPELILAETMHYFGNVTLTLGLCQGLFSAIWTHSRSASVNCEFALAELQNQINTSNILWEVLVKTLANIDTQEYFLKNYSTILASLKVVLGNTITLGMQILTRVVLEINNPYHQLFKDALLYTGYNQRLSNLIKLSDPGWRYKEVE
jgi:hypothetical protein